MVQLIVGNKGKGKTKYLLDKVNEEIKEVSGNVVFLDKSAKHMYELNNKVRLISMKDFMITKCDEFIGFLSGVLSQDHDLEKMYFDNFLDIACIDCRELESVFHKLEKLSKQFEVSFILSISANEDEIPEAAKSSIVLSL